MNRQLFTTEEDHNALHVIGYIIGLLYIFGFIYYIYKKYLYLIFEDLLSLLDDNESEETLRPILYSFLHSIQYLMLSFFSTFSSKSTLGVSAIVGSDAFNIFLIFGLILVKHPQSQHGTLDTWTTARDVSIYIVALIVILLCLITDWVELGTSLILLGYYILNIGVIFANQDIKEKIMEWLNISNEDNEFSSDQHLEYKKRRFSITHLKDAGFIDMKDVNLQKRLNRMEALLVLRYGADDPRKKSRSKIQGAVYVVLFALRNQIKSERQKRTEFYINMYKPKQRAPRSEDQRPPQFQQEEQDDDHPLMNRQSDSNPLESVNQIQERDNNSQNQQPPDRDAIERDEGPNLRFPQQKIDQVLWIIFFPVHLILYTLPNYIENPVPKKLVLCFFLNICLLGGCNFLLDWWAWEFSIATGIPIQIIGIVVFGSLLSIEFIKYNIDVAAVDTKLEFVQAFYQTAICKITLCTGLPWLLRVIVELDIDLINSRAYDNAFSIAMAVLAGCSLIFILLAALKRFILTSEDGVKLIVIYSLFILSSTIIIALNILA